MGFFSNPRKAFKGFCRDPVGRISKDLGFTPKCPAKQQANACVQGFNSNLASGAIGGAAVGSRLAGGPGVAAGAVVGGISSGTTGCVTSIQAYRATCPK